MVDTLGIQLLLQVVDELRVGYVGQLGLGVVRQEGVENVLGVVEEVEDEGRLSVFTLLLLGIRVKTRV